MDDIKKLTLPFIFMVGAFLGANYFVQFPFQPFGLKEYATWGTFAYPITFLVNDLTNRFYGTRQTTKLILVSFLAGLIIVGLTIDLRLALASAVAFLVAQQLDNKIFDSLRGGVWWRAPVISSLIASFIDTWVFYGIAFYGVSESADYFGFTLPLWVGWSVGDLAFKLALALLLLLPYRAFLLLTLSRQNAAAP